MDQQYKQKGSTFAGIMIGIILAMLVIGGMLWFINTQKSPFKETATPAPSKTQVQTVKKPHVERLTQEKQTDEIGRLIEDLHQVPLEELPATLPIIEKTEKIAKEDKAAQILNGRIKQADTPIKINHTKNKILQIGSFSDPQQAQAQQAKLLMINVKTKIQAALVQEKKVYRVYSGSLNEQAAKQLQQELHQQGIDSLIISTP